MPELMRPAIPEASHEIHDCDWCGEPVDFTDGQKLYRVGDGIYRQWVCAAHLCSECGEIREYFLPVEDRDDSVGYRDTLLVCDVCALRRRHGN